MERLDVRRSAREDRSANRRAIWSKGSNWDKQVYTAHERTLEGSAMQRGMRGTRGTHIGVSPSLYRVPTAHGNLGVAPEVHAEMEVGVNDLLRMLLGVEVAHAIFRRIRLVRHPDCRQICISRYSKSRIDALYILWSAGRQDVCTALATSRGWT